MSNREFTAQRTMLANAMATAGAELLEYMGVSSALAAIPNTEPQQYVVAGTLAMIAKVLPAEQSSTAGAARQGGITSLEGLTDDHITKIATKAFAAGEINWAGFTKDENDRYMVPVISPMEFGLVRAVLKAVAAPVPPLAAPAPLTDELPELPHPLEIDWPQLHSEALGCGVEDRGIRDRYEAAEYGWQVGMEAASERVPELIYDEETVLAIQREAYELGRAKAAPAAPVQATEPSSAVLDVPGAIMNIPCRRADSDFPDAASRLLYKEGHRDARHDAADLVLEFADKLADLAAPVQAEQAQAEPINVAEMVNRFLGWKLPKDFSPDCGISFDGRGPDARGYDRGWPTGTNLFHAGQAKEMFEHCLKGAVRPTDDDLWDQTLRQLDHNADMADKLAEAIGRHFGIEIGEHSNINCPWQTALDWIENESTHAEMQAAALPAQAEQAAAVRAAEWLPIETAPKDMASRLYLIGRFCVQGFVDAVGELMVQSEVSPHWRKMRGKPTHWMPLPSAPSTATSNDTAALGDTGGDK
jgi:hypothetical protein